MMSPQERINKLKIMVQLAKSKNYVPKTGDVQTAPGAPITNVPPEQQPKQPDKFSAVEGQAGVALNLDFANFIKQEQQVFNMMNPFASKESREKSNVELKQQMKYGQEQFKPYKEDPKTVFVSPLAITGYTLPISYGTGAGLGALKAAYPTAAKVVGGALAGYAIKETAQGGYEAYKSGNLVNYAGQSALQFGLGGSLFKKGYTSAGGRVEQALYLRKTFPKGSPEYIRLQSATKVARLVENVRPIKTELLQLEKIERFTPETVAKTKEFFIKNPKEVVGGSAAAYSQVENARAPRDIDILIQSRGNVKGVIKQLPSAISERKNPLTLANIEQVSKAKRFFGSLQETAKGEHAIDIHGREMYTPGTEHRFGFQTKEPIKIGQYKLMRSGEQLFRKAVGGTTKETEYRWYKDIPDFIATAESQIKSAKQSIITRSKGIKAEKYLDIFKKELKGTPYEVPSKLKTNIPEFLEAPQRKIRTGVPRQIEKAYEYTYKGGKKLPSAYPYSGQKKTYPSVAKYPGYKSTIKTFKPYMPSKPYRPSPYKSTPYKPEPYVPKPYTPKPYAPSPPYRPKNAPGKPYVTKSVSPRYVLPVKPYRPVKKEEKSKKKYYSLEEKKKDYINRQRTTQQKRDYRQRSFKLGEIYGGK